MVGDVIAITLETLEPGRISAIVARLALLFLTVRSKSRGAPA
jgi:hypothetical protein